MMLENYDFIGVLKEIFESLRQALDAAGLMSGANQHSKVFYQVTQKHLPQKSARFMLITP